MYLGIDYLLDESGSLYISEVNTGLPGGAREYDLIHRIRFNKPSGIFDRIEAISEKKFSRSFTRYIRGLPYYNELKALKIWMDGMGPLPSIIPEMLRLEDKWVQYRLLAGKYPLVYSRLYDPEKIDEYIADIEKYGGIVLKRRLGRGGAGFIKIESFSGLKGLLNANLSRGFYMVQPLISSRLRIRDKYFRLSIRAMVFAGEFLCMFANISSRITSNHGIRFHINPCDSIGVENEYFRVIEITEKAWEADVFYEGEPPGYLYHNLYEEEISDSFLNLPEKIHSDIIEISVSIGNLYSSLDIDDLPACFIEEEGCRQLQEFESEK